MLTDAKADYVLAHKDAFAFGNLPCTARRAVARIARYRAEDCESTLVRSNPSLLFYVVHARMVLHFGRIAIACKREAIRTF